VDKLQLTLEALLQESQTGKEKPVKLAVLSIVTLVIVVEFLCVQMDEIHLNVFI
jgi:hypothetical protein